jgi:hypothetical protein
MARTATRSEIRARARRWSGLRSGQNWTDTELNDEIDLEVAYVYNKLVAARGAKYYESPTPSSFSSVVGTETYNLPADFFESSRLCVVVNGREYGLDPYMDKEIDGTRPVNQVWSCRLYYVPVASKLTLDATTFDGINGFERLVSLRVALAVKQETEEDLSGLLTMIQLAEAEIDKLKSMRDRSGPHRMSDALTIGRLPWWNHIADGGERPRYQIKNGVISLREGFAV